MDKSIGDLFRDYAEQYIRIYKPDIHKIKLIRAIRLCKTPALGARVISCLTCEHNKVIYLSCGHTQCPLCQYHKRKKWQSKLSDKLLKVPYVHTVFTIPHELNRICKSNPKIMYSLIMKASYKCIKDLGAKQENLGALPGMVSVLHTFGSDMKYHLHVHSLITFGGIDKDGQWKWPKRKKKIAGYRDICRTFREVFLNMLRKEIRKGTIITQQDIEDVITSVENKRWNVRNGYPTMDLKVIENYLARYINRVAISKGRFEYLAKQRKVNIIYKEYRKQKENQAAPLAIKTIDPLVAIDQFLQHILPPYFQKSRYYGLHASSTFKKYASRIDQKLLKNKDSISTMFSMLMQLLKVAQYSCEKCQSMDFKIRDIPKDKDWIFKFITLPNFRGPPKSNRHIKLIH